MHVIVLQKQNIEIVYGQWRVCLEKAWMKKRMDMSERLIAICPIVKCWTPDKTSAQGHVGTRTNQGPRIDYITEKPYLHHQLGVPRAPILAYLQLLVDTG